MSFPNPLAVHTFVHSGQRTWNGASICARCDNVRKHRVHDVPEVGDEAKALTERMMGEGNGGQQEAQV